MMYYFCGLSMAANKKKDTHVRLAFGVAGFQLTFEERFAQLAAMAGGAVKAAELCGVSRNTFYLWGKGETRMPLEAALKLAEAAGVTLDWVATGWDRRPGLPETSNVAPPPLHPDLLQASIKLVEEWLEENRRTMAPDRKADVVSKIYQLLVEDAAAGATSVDQTKIRQFLRLVA